ncbi:MAG: efflux RND transporter permease subunit, partial [Rhodopila sp.]
LSQGQPAVLVILFRQPGANIIETVDAVKAAIPQLMAAMPADMNLLIANDRTTTIRASLHDTERTLLIAVGLVTLVVFLFLRSARATLIPAIAVPVSIIGTFGAMYLMGYSLDNLSLMALTVATGFVVDDAIVVLENISRHLEAGMSRVQAALQGAKEVGFTVVSISLSLIAVFLPILLMGGIVGRLFREFAITLSMAIMVSLAISLTTTPMMCAIFLRPAVLTAPKKKTLLERAQAVYGRTLAWSLRHSALVMLVLLITVALNVALFIAIPKGFFPQQDTGRMMGGLQADQSISFQAMEQKLTQLSDIVQHDPAVQSVVGFTGQGSGGAGGQTNTGRVFVALKPLAQRAGVDVVMTRLRRALAVVPGAQLFLIPIQDISVGGRQTNAAYQYTLQADSTADLYEWAPKLTAALEHDPVLRDVNSDQQQKGLETDLVIDRATASRLGINPSQIDNTLYDAFGQRQVSTIYSAQNQYHVVMEVAPRYWQSPQTLRDIYVSTSGGNASGTEATNAVVGTVTAATTAKSSSSSTTGSSSSSSATSKTSTSSSSTSSTTTAASIASSSARNAATNALAATGKSSASSAAAVSTSQETMVPLSAITKYGPGSTPLAVNHQGPFVAATISFNLAPGKSLSDAVTQVAQAEASIHMPASIHGSFQGTARTFQESVDSEPLLIAAALVAVYIVLGVLYESYIHPITIISTLPSAGVGAWLALMLFNTEFSIIALIGVILLIGIVKKNAIMMIDFALDAERTRNLSPHDAIFQACLMRFRPILMTTSAAMLGALPLALSFGDGGEIRRPLGISIVGGLMVSQVLTLYTTPVVYLYLDRFRLFSKRQWNRAFPGLAAPEAAE